jgi:hypothetical protein
MWLVLCTSDDLPALWAARGLAARGLQPLEIVTAEALMYNRSFEHRLVAGKASVRITLADGRVIDSATVRGTLNRIQTVPFLHLRAQPADRQYAEQELFALYLSWLDALPGKMLNRPTPRSLCGEWRHPAEWAWLANQAGLPASVYGQSDVREAPAPRIPAPSTRSIVVVDGICCGASAPPDIAAGCSRLSEISAIPLLGIDFHVSRSDQWVFTSATPMPVLQLGGDKLQDALVSFLRP